MGAQVVHEGRVAIHLAFIDAQLLDNNLLHLLLNCHDSSWDFCERVDFSYLRGFSASRCVVSNPPFCHILANPAGEEWQGRGKAAWAADDAENRPPPLFVCLTHTDLPLGVQYRAFSAPPHPSRRTCS